MTKFPLRAIAAVIMTALSIGESLGADWPMWRYDAARGASSPHDLPESMNLLWSRDLRPARPAWPKTQKKLQFDEVPQPIVMGNHLIIPSTVNDSVSAFDTTSGMLTWRYFADGPVRFSPAGYKDRIFLVSDDGYLTCLRAKTGELLWKINGGPAERKVIGNHRLVSSWPARGGPVVQDGKVYFSASIWPFMGIFIHAVDAESGETLWTNSGDGTNYTVQPHGAPSFAAVVPQGHLAISGENLVVPGGRSTPAVFELATGKLKHFLFDKKNGGHQVMAGRDSYVVAGGPYNMVGGKRLSNDEPRLAEGDFFVFEEKGSIYSKNPSTDEVNFAIGVKEGPHKLFLKAGGRVYTAGDHKVAAYETAGGEGDRIPAWLAEAKGSVHHMLAGDDKLFVVTDEPRIYCFGAGAHSPKHYRVPKIDALPEAAPGDRFAKLAASVLKERGLQGGFGLALGVGTGRLLAEILNQSKLHLVVLDRAAEKVDLVRQRCDKAAIYGTRLAAHVGDVSTASLPPYLASLIICENLSSAGFEEGKPDFIENIFRALRPYGGIAIMLASRQQHDAVAAALKTSSVADQAELSWKDGVTRLSRPGALPRTDDWTHQYGNPGQTGISKDQLVKAPLGLLWFGGPTHEGILPRHGHGPSPQVAGGRLFIEGPHMLRAVDVYTGRVLWEKEMKDFGKFYNTTKHFSGAGEIGSNYVSLPDRLYAVHDKRIVELDAATGETLKTMTLGGQEDGHWGYLGVEGDYLVATSSPVKVTAPKDEEPKEKRSNFWDKLEESRFSSGSRRLVVFDRHTGKPLWKREAVLNFRHNNIAISETIVFCTDAATETKLAGAGGEEVPPTLYALDLKTGEEFWKTSENVFGTFFSYSAEHDILLQAGSKYRDRADDEIGKGMIAYRGTTGDVLWHNEDIDYSGPCLLWRDRIITNGNGGFALELLTGKRIDWSYKRMYGCNTAIGSEHLLTFRSGAAGFYDLSGDSGTGNIGGFRSSCTNNLIVANGVLNAPDYTRTCSCAYQNQTSLALIHMPEAEFWTFGAKHAADRIGINFGAPGDRRDPKGTLWTEFPSVGGPSDEVEVMLSPWNPEVFRLHSSTFRGDGLVWVGASGIMGVESISIPAESLGAYRVRLLFAEPNEGAKPGERVMDVALQGKTVLTKFDICKEAGGAHSLLAREFEVTAADGKIVIDLKAHGPLPTSISGVELVRK